MGLASVYEESKSRSVFFIENYNYRTAPMITCRGPNLAPCLSYVLAHPKSICAALGHVSTK